MDREAELIEAIYAAAMVLRHHELVGDALLPAMRRAVEAPELDATGPAERPPMPECPVCGWPRTIGRFHDPELPASDA